MTAKDPVTLISEERDAGDGPQGLSIDWDGTRAVYIVGDVVVPADVYRDVIATRHAMHLRTLDGALDEIAWSRLGSLVDRLHKR